MTAFFDTGLRRPDEDWLLRHRHDGRTQPLDVAGWARLDAVDDDLLDRAVGPVLDVGCGPGRLCAALARRGVPVLGIDLSPAAVRQTRAAGGFAVRTSVFGPVPSAGQWATALLVDGNIGIGGNTRRLLRRVGTLLRPGGEVLVELTAPGTGARQLRVRLETSAGEAGPWFPWAVLPADRVQSAAARAGLTVDEVWEGSGRWFARCRKR